jgi:hypothetical protein
MNASQPARRLAVSAIVTAAVAAWFALATGTVFAEAIQPRVAPAAPSQIELTPQGTMRLTVVAARPAAAPAQITMTPEGSMRLTVVAQRTHEAPMRTAAAREASRT